MPTSWEGQLIECAVWLTNVTREYSAPDLWAELAKRKELVTQTEAVPNTSFDVGEQAEIVRKLDEIKVYARTTFELTAAEQAQLDAELDYLKDAATRVGRLDWRNALLGALIAKMIDASLPQSAVQDVVNLILQGVAHMYGILDWPTLPPHVG